MSTATIIVLIGVAICIDVVAFGIWIVYDDYKYWGDVESRNSTSELRNPHKRDQWG